MDRILAVRKIHGIMAPRAFMEMYKYKIPFERRNDYWDVLKSHKHPYYKDVWKELMEQETFEIDGSDYKLRELKDNYYFVKQ